MSDICRIGISIVMITMPTRQRLLEMLQGLDDRVQTAARSGYAYVGDRMPGETGNFVKGFGEVVHPYRYGADQPASSRVATGAAGTTALYGTRALQAGGLTAAGVGLANLATAIGNTFGGPADGRQPDTLPM